MLHTYQANLANLAGTMYSLPELRDTEDTTLDDQHCLYKSHAHEVNKHPPDYQLLRPMFGWLPADLIKQTFEVTTQYARLPISTLLKKQYKSLFPLLMSIGEMNWLLLIPSIQTHPLLTQEPPLPKFLLVWSLL